MPRGRPRKNTSEDTITKVDIMKEEIPSDVIGVKIEDLKKKKSAKEPKIICNCTLCDAPIYSSPYKVQLQQLTGKASWHRECSVESLALCDKCAKELNTTIDAFLIKKNKSLKKFA